MNDKIFLNVAYQDKEQVKSLGATWSPEEKKWFVPDELDSSLFSQWLEQPVNSIQEKPATANSPQTAEASDVNDELFNIKAITPFYLLTANEACPICNQATQVVGFAAQGIEEDNELQQGFVRFNFVEVLPERLSNFISSHYPQYQLSEVTDRISGDPIQCYSNHCQHCNGLIIDSKLHSEPAHAFYPTSNEAAEKVEKIELKSQGKVKLTAATAYSAPDLIGQFAKHSLYNPTED